MDADTAFRVGNREIGAGKPCFIIAEAGVNHNGELEKAFRLVDKSIEVGADAVKFQTFDPKKIASRFGGLAEYQKGAGVKYARQVDMLENLKLTHKEFEQLAKYCREKGQTFASTPFESSSLRFLLALGIPFVKVSSSDLTNHPYLSEIAKAGKPVILSTGMGNMGEIAEAVGTLKESGCTKLLLMHCTSQYPAPPETLNVSAIRALREMFRLPVGFSDHSAGHEADVLALAYGACAIEKHFTLDNVLPGPDHKASLNPADFAAMVKAVRKAEKMIGNGERVPTEGEKEMMTFSRKSIVAARSLPVGHTLQEKDLAIKRPGNGLPPKFIKAVLGKRLKRAVARDQLLKLEDFEA